MCNAAKTGSQFYSPYGVTSLSGSVDTFLNRKNLQIASCIQSKENWNIYNDDDWILDSYLK